MAHSVLDTPPSCRVHAGSHYRRVVHLRRERPARGHLRLAWAEPAFRRLLAVRLVGQFGDGVFQASLAGAVLFNPHHQARAADVAAGFAVLLLPYSLIGPFAGVLLDRWWRQRILVVANLLRAVLVVLVAAEIAGGFAGVGFYGSALVVISLSRFVNSALSAALPHVVGPDELVTANAISTTCGTIAATVGGAVAVGVRALAGGGDRAYAAVAAAALVPYLIAAGAARPFPLAALGPDDAERAHRETLRQVAVGLAAGARHAYSRPPARNALAAIGVHRLCFGLWTVTTLLLYRNYFRADGVLRSGLAGLTQVVALVALGGGLAALATPPLARRLGYGRWPAALLAASGVVVAACTLPYRLAPVLLAALLLGFASQGIKICVDTLVQTHVDDEFRGRVFALYDALFNLALVVAAVLTALVLPEDGHTPRTAVVVAAVYLLTAATYLAASRWSGAAGPAGAGVRAAARSTSA
jgi:MFS family permease